MLDESRKNFHCFIDSLLALFSQLLEFFKQLNVATCCRSTLYTLQSLYVNNIVYSYWLRMQEKIINTIRARGEPISVSGDGQFDSPGFTAAYCFYRYRYLPIFF
jgi:hypothetical protein